MGLPLADFLAGLRSDATREAYAVDLRQFLRADPERATPRELGRFSAREVLDYYKRIDRRFKKATVARKIATIRSSFGWLVKRGVIGSNPAAIVHPPRPPETTTTHALSESAAARLLDSIPRTTAMGRRDYAILMLLLHNGLRRSEISALRRADLKSEVDGTTVALVRHGRRVRAVKLKPEVVAAISAYHDGADPGTFVFAGHSNRHGTDAGPALSPKAVWLIARRRGHVSPNALRVTHITTALRRGCPLSRLQAAVGHARAETTMRYGRLLDGAGEHATDFVSFRKRR